MDHSIIRQLHQAALKQDADTGKVSSKTKADIEAILEDIGPKADNQKLEVHTDDIFLAAAAAEENGFVRGFLYAFQLFNECTGK